MKKPSYRDSNLTILLIGSLLTIYLAALVAFAWIGQERLRESLLEQEQLSAEKRATAVSLFVAELRISMAKVSGSRAISSFLANRDLGMSMEYGLGASLKAVAREFEALLRHDDSTTGPIFRRVRLLDRGGAVLVDVGSGPPIETRAKDLAMEQFRQLRVETTADGNILTLGAVVVYKGEVRGYVLSTLDVVAALQPLIHDSPAPGERHIVALVDATDRAIVTSDQSDWHNWRDRAEREKIPVISATVDGTGWQIVSLPFQVIEKGIIASPLFLAALALIGIPLLAGIAYLWRLNNHNLVLRTRFHSGNRERALLRAQNERLQGEINKRAESEEKLAHQANFDQLTGMPNRHLAMDRLAQAVKSARRDKDEVLILFLDLDRFKQVNDSLGHAAGDELLREASHRLKACIRDSDTVARLGGDEFLVICPQMPEGAAWEELAQMMLKTLADPFYIGDHEFFIGASIGVASYPVGGSEPQKLLKNADIAMYAAKEQGRNRCCRYDPMMDAVTTQAMKLERNLRHALERNELYLEYQPIVDLSSGRTIAVEALLRWENDELGAVTPDRFIPIAEETGVIHEIGEWVLHEACSTIGALRVDPDFRVAVNLSSRQFNHPARLLDCVLQALRKSGLMPNQLELEITESILIDDRPEITGLINQLDRIGVRLSIDDFGTGYSALNYLQRFPFDILKIDKGFTMQVPDVESNATLIRAIIAMAHALDLEVIAEGIETRAQAGFLLVHRCEFGQGFLYSRPLTVAQLHGHLGQLHLSTA